MCYTNIVLKNPYGTTLRIVGTGVQTEARKKVGRGQGEGGVAP